MKNKSPITDEELVEWLKEFLLGNFGDSYEKPEDLTNEEIVRLLIELIG